MTVSGAGLQSAAINALESVKDKPADMNICTPQKLSCSEGVGGGHVRMQRCIAVLSTKVNKSAMQQPAVATVMRC